ncbi:MAG: radical SAM family heme chaperone HemW [Bdellovibrionaceae bacterium]|jgi:oxygen-independent coproporphyrinogen III oxidase|nr:radical SAM family heme chaperone HemW [Pseudobdellovibrionaceae bacterium]
MKFGIYIHIPYCVQRCPYCDFTTFEQSQIISPENYTELILREIQLMHNHVPLKEVNSIFWGGGTPSLFDPKLLADILEALKNVGFHFAKNFEMTLEINPKTISINSFNDYLKMGFNRFSVGAQSFNDQHLKTCGRIHSSEDTMNTIELLKSHNTNFSLDLLYALPRQSMDDLKQDLRIIDSFSPPHVSTYCLTVPKSNPLAQNRPEEKVQILMAQEITQSLERAGLYQYEISNHAKPGYQSVHNQIYWSNDSYWGLGLSAHSYFNHSIVKPFGGRFWNIKNIEKYEKLISITPQGDWDLTHNLAFKHQGFELLKSWESLTDYCHMHLRTELGLSQTLLNQLYPDYQADLESRFRLLEQKGYIYHNQDAIKLSLQGKNLFNEVLRDLTFGAPQP